MEIKNTKLRILRKAFISMFLMLAMVLAVLPLGNIGGLLQAKADAGITDVDAYSNVLDDLKKDESFDVEDYPIQRDDYSLHVIQVAISNLNELFVYVYSPADFLEFTASSINISTTIGEALAPKNYKLELLNREGVLAKYKVLNVPKSDTNVDFYEIVSIFRPFDDRIDGKAEGDNTISEVSYAVGQQWTIFNNNGNIEYFMIETETIEVTDKFVGFIRYDAGFNPFHKEQACDAHFVAFDTDREIDTLIEADVIYTTQQRTVYVGTPAIVSYKPIFETPVENIPVTLNASKEVVYETNGFFKYKYSWNEIESAKDFIDRLSERTVYEHGLINIVDEVKLKPESEASIKSKKWVLNFLVTDVLETQRKGNYPPPMSAAPFTYTERVNTIVSDVSILRLYFETDGKIYNLGVVDNKQTGSLDPVGTTNRKPELADWVWWVIAIAALLLILLLIIWFEPIRDLLMFLFDCFFWLMVGVWYIVASPGYLCALIIKTAKKRKRSGSRAKARGGAK